MVTGCLLGVASIAVDTGWDRIGHVAVAAAVLFCVFATAEQIRDDTWLLRRFEESVNASTVALATRVVLAGRWFEHTVSVRNADGLVVATETYRGLRFAMGRTRGLSPATRLRRTGVARGRHAVQRRRLLVETSGLRGVFALAWIAQDGELWIAVRRTADGILVCTPHTTEDEAVAQLTWEFDEQ